MRRSRRPGPLLWTGTAMALGVTGCSSTVAVSANALRSLPSLAGLPVAATSVSGPAPVLALALAAPISCAGTDTRRQCTARVTYSDVGHLALVVPVARTTALVSAGAVPELSTTTPATLTLSPGEASTVEWSASTHGDLVGVALVYAGFRYSVSSAGATAVPATGAPVPASPDQDSTSPTAAPTRRTPPTPSAAHTTVPAAPTTPPIYVPPVTRTFPVAPPVHRSTGGDTSVSATIG